jgi:hypothetical protein
MSLVNEALKKAHAEANRQRAEATATLVGRPAAKLHSPQVRKPKSEFVIALVGALFVVVLSATVLRVTAGSTPSLAGAARLQTAYTPTIVARIQPRVSLTAPPAPTPVETEKKKETPPETPNQAPADPAKIELPISKQYETVAQSFTSPPPEIQQGKVYIQSLDLPNVPKLQLNGILWSDKPLAILNNVTVAPGEDLNDVTVIAIEPKRVKLSAQGKEFFIRLP